jgi:hypothetical protein
MAEFRYGPVELYLVGFEGESPDAGVLSALADLVEGGTLRVLDLVLVSKTEEGDVTIAEFEDEELALELHEVGIAAEEDIFELAELVPPGASAILVALELLYARTLAERVAAAGAIVLSAERIPAPIVNAVMDLATEA